MPIPIEFDKPRTLKFDLAALRDLEAAAGGKPLGEVLGQIAALGINALTVALWAGLKHEDKSLNLGLVTRMLDAHLRAGIGETRDDHKTRLRILGDALDEAVHETGLFERGDGQGNARPEATT